jgi:signal transduction histidine kinase
MIWGMSALTARLYAARNTVPRWKPLPAVLAGVAGCLFLVVATSPLMDSGGEGPPFLSVSSEVVYQGFSGVTWLGLLLVLAPVAVVLLGLCLLRWWPYLLAVAGLMAVPGVISDWNPSIHYPLLLSWLLELLPPSSGYALAVVAVLACAQGLTRTTPGWGAAVVALTLGSRLLGSAMTMGQGWQFARNALAYWHTGLLGAGLAMLVPAIWLYRRGDPAASPVTDPAGRRWRRGRLVVAGTLAAGISLPLTFLSTQSMEDLLGVTFSALYRHSFAQTAVIGAVTLVAVALLAALAGRWPLAGTLTAAVAQVAVTAPVTLALAGLSGSSRVCWLAALAGAVVGAAAVGSRLRVPLAATLAVLAAVALFIATAATTGDPEKLAEQQVIVPTALILVLCAAAGSAVIGATAPMLGSRGALPATLGPLAGTLAVGGLETIQVTYFLNDGGPDTQAGSMTSSAILLLVGAAAIGGMGFAHLLATRSAERKHAEQIRHEATTAERDRLGRSIHDGVLQVLALVQRQGPGLGARGSELAALAGEQEAALRGLLAGAPGTGGGAAEDLCGPLQALAAPLVEVAAPAQAVKLPSGITAEVVAAVRAALDNVRKHAGADARAWILLEDEQDGVRVTIRDDGTGFPPQRPAEAAEAGRLGIAQSMRGRIADCGGTTTIDSRPGEGTEVEFWIPRVRQARR